MDAKLLMSENALGDPVEDSSKRGTNEAFLQMSLYTEAVMEIEKSHPDYDGKYLEVEVFPYTDSIDGGVPRLAVLVSFIQNHDQHDDKLDHNVMEKLVEVVSNLEPSHIVNDVTVNGLQWRDGIVKNFVME